MISSRALSVLVSALLLTPPEAFANPLGGQVVGGSATIQGQGTSTVTVNQGSDRSIINWNTFNIGAGERTQFNQPGSGSIALNRVTGNLGPSQIYGTIQANGHVFLVNPDGVLFGAGAQINTGGFLATTSDIKNSDFMAGNYVFSIPGHPNASIVNLGTITASNGGFAALVAPGVRNSGVITANLGSVALASGNGFTLDFYGDKLITLQIGDQIANKVVDVATGKTLDALVKNDGKLKANGGQVQLTAVAARHVVDSVINNTGVIQANTIGSHKGMIVLGAATSATKGAGAPVQTVKVSGTLSAHGHKSGTKGGTIQITGEDIALTGAKIDATGDSGGGTVLIGGDIGGGHPSSAAGGIANAQLQPWPVATASTINIDAATVIDASAKVSGDGGKVVMWSNQMTSFAGLIKATGGTNSGNGGFTEVSSKGVLNYTGLADLSAPKGTFGTLLLDPSNVVICDDCSNGTINSADLESQLNHSNVIVTTNAPGEDVGNITLVAPLNWSAASTLTFEAANNIYLNSSVTAWNGGLTLSAQHNVTTSSFGAVNVGTFTFQNGSWTQVLGQGSLIEAETLPAFSAADFRVTGGTFLRAQGGSGTDSWPYQISDIYGLQGIGSPSNQLLNKSFVLANNIDASGTKNWNGGQGFVPIGRSGQPFMGFFDGQYYGQFYDGPNWAIHDLTIAPNASGLNSIGLFGANSGVIQNLNLSNISVTANPNANFSQSFPFQTIGTLAGQNTGTITNVSVSGQIDGKNLAGVTAGGLVGQNGIFGQSEQSASITNSHANVKVSLGDGVFCGGVNCGGGFNSAGGLVGVNIATVRDSSAGGDVTVGANTFAGGLVGINQNSTFNSDNNQSQPLSGPQIIDSFATSNVRSDGVNVSLGGLVGFNASKALIDGSFASGNVTSTASVHNVNNGDCSSSCQWANTGGLVGQNQGTISFSGADGDVSVGSGGTGGGLVGWNDGRVLTSFAFGNVIGAAGPGNNNFGNETTLGGLVGQNSGLIDSSGAAGNVGTAGIAFLKAGGLAGGNNGTITNSIAIGIVSAGDHSQAGGLVANNNVPDNNNCNNGCIRGDGYNANARVADSFAFGDVTVGAFSLAGGLVGSSGNFKNTAGVIPTIDNSFAAGNVTGGGNSIIGGFIGVSDIGSLITNSQSFGSTTSLGANSILGGFIGVNGGTVAQSQSASAVSGTSDSFLGGFAGINVGAITDSIATVNASVAGSGSNNYAGGFVGLNFGTIDPSSAAGAVTSGANSVVGGFAAANGTFANLSSFVIPGSSFPGGTISGDSTATGAVSGGSNSTVNPQIAVSNPSSTPTYPSVIATCDATLCQIFDTGQLTPTDNPRPPLVTPPPLLPPQVTPAPPLPPPVRPLPSRPLTLSLQFPAPPQQQVVSLTVDPFNALSPPTFINLTQPQGSGGQGGGGQGGQGGGGQGGGSGGNGATPPTPGGPPPGPGIGRTLSEQQISGVPPIGETRFLPGEIVLQISNTISVDQIQQVAQQLGLTVLASQNFDAAGRMVYRFNTNGKDVRQVIRTLEQNRIVASAEPNYVFGLAQAAVPGPEDQTGSLPPPELQSDLANADVAARSGPLPVGDAAQYIIGKLHLAAIHQRVRGRNVPIAVIDSEIDPQHPDLAGVIAERFDATGTASNPHAHGTGMAGAIASHQRLLGIAPGVRILAVKAFDETAASAEATSFQILKALDYAMSKNVRIINMSFAGPRDPMMERVLKTAYDKGIILIAAAGNAGPKSPPLYPGADPSVIAVTATDYADKPFAMANRGKYIAVAAPGVDVLVPAPSSGYQLTTGTSVAAAHVSGVAALLIETKPTITPAEVRAILTRTSHAITLRAKDDPTGAGLVDPVQALQSLAPPRSAEAARERTEEFGSAIASPAARRRAARHARCVVSLRGGARPNRSWRPMSTVV